MCLKGKKEKSLWKLAAILIKKTPMLGAFFDSIISFVIFKYSETSLNMLFNVPIFRNL
jgi:hypothetical protein